MMEQITFPRLYCPFPSAINPRVEAVQAQSLAWVERFHLVQRAAARQRFSASRFGWLAARAYPLAGLEELTIVCDWNVWLFLLDDHCDEGGIGKEPDRLQEVFAGLLALLEDEAAASASGPLANSLRDLWERMSARATPAWKARFRQDAGEYFAACVWEAANRANRVTPTLKDYVARRPLTGGLITDVDLIDLTEHIDLPDAVRESEIVQRLTNLANNVVCWSNDIISLQKEMQRGDVHNLVLAIQQQEGCSLQAAVDCAAALHDAEVRGFLALERRLPRYGRGIDRDLRRYVGVLRSWMRGNLEWSRETGRYRPREAELVATGYLEPILEQAARPMFAARR